jgi:hypothetical protein
MNLIYNLISKMREEKMGEEKMGEEEIGEEEMGELEMGEEETEFVEQLRRESYVICFFFNIYIYIYIPRQIFGNRGDYPWLPKISSHQPDI